MVLIDLPFLRGQDSKADTKIAPLGALKRAENCRITKDGRLTKRRGLQEFTLSTISSLAVGDPGSAPTSLAELNGVRLAEMTDYYGNPGILHDYQDNAGKWRRCGQLPIAQVPRRREAIRNLGVSATAPSVAVIGNYVCVVAESEGIYAALYDRTTWQLLSYTRLQGTAAMVRPQVVAAGQTFVVSWLDTNLWRLKYSTITLTAPPLTWGPPGNISTTVHTAHIYFAIGAYSSTEILVVWQQTSTDFGVGVLNVFTGAVNSSTVTAFGYPAVCGVPSEYASIAWHDPSTGTVWRRSTGGAGGNPLDGATAGNFSVVVGADVVAQPPVIARQSATSHWVGCSRSDVVDGPRTRLDRFDPVSGAWATQFTQPGGSLASGLAIDEDTLELLFLVVTHATLDRVYVLRRIQQSGLAQYTATETTIARSEAVAVAASLPAPAPALILSNDSGRELTWAFPYIAQGSVASSDPYTAIDVAQIRLDSRERQYAAVGGCLYMTGGLLTVYDGEIPYEVGWLTAPRTYTASAAAGGSLTGSSTYQYVVTREWYDAKGQKHISAPSDPATVTLAFGEGTVNLDIAGDLFTNRYTNADEFTTIDFYARLHVWRTLSNGTVFYRVTGDAGIAQPLDTGATITYVDTDADSVLAGASGRNVVLYTQGARGGLSGPLQHDPAPPCRYLWAGKDRFILGGLERSDEIRWSKTFFRGEPVEFSEDIAFRKRIPGDVTGVASLDDAWFAFTASQVFAIYGDGPDDSGVGAFTEPRALPSEVGCVSAASILETPVGLFFQGSARGLYLLPRGGASPIWISEPVRDVFENAPAACTVVAAKLLSASGVAVFGVSDGDTYQRTLVYDLRTGQWLVDVPFGGSVPGLASFAVWNGLLALQNEDSIFVESESATVSDDGSWFGVVIETQALRPGGLQADVRLRKLSVLAEYRGECRLQYEFAADDARTYNSVAALWTVSGLTAGDPVRREWRMPEQKFGSVRFRISEMQSGSALTAGLAFSGLTFEVQPRAGMPRLPSSSRA
jgi:hypothetical protein